MPFTSINFGVQADCFCAWLAPSCFALVLSEAAYSAAHLLWYSVCVSCLSQGVGTGVYGEFPLVECMLFSSVFSMRLKPGVDLNQLFLTSSLCWESCKVEVTHVNIYLITTHELCRALSSLWERHDLHYNDTVDIFPVTLIVTSLLPVGIFGLIRQLVQAI